MDLFRDGRISTLYDDIFISYTRARLLNGHDQKSVTVAGPGHDLTEQCFLALSTAFYGADQMDASITQHGLERYERALKQLNQALGDPTRHRTLDILDAVIVMSLFEFLVSEREDGWVQHARGLESLFALRGPESFTSPLALLVLERARMSMISAALVSHRTTILARADWKTVPWSSSSNGKSALQYLLDILSDCPALFVARDNVNSSAVSEDLNSDYRLLSEKAHELLEGLEQWERTWTGLHANCSYEDSCPMTTPCSTDARGLLVAIWPTVFQYRSLYHAKAMVLHNAARILLLQYILDLGATGTGLLVSRPCLTETMCAAGIAICRSVDYHLDRIRQGAGSFFLLFPLRMAFDAVGPHNLEVRAWLRSVLNSISSGSVGRWAAAKHQFDGRRLEGD